MSSRPVYLNLRQFHFPLNAQLSILHRITGTLLVLFCISGLGILDIFWFFPDLLSPSAPIWQSGLGKGYLWLGLSALLFHWLSGIRHLGLSLLPQLSYNARQRTAQWLLVSYFLCWAFLTGVVWL